MLAKFENGYYLEVVHEKKENEYGFTIYDKKLCYVDHGYTEYRSIEMYYPLDEIGYILEYCEPDKKLNGVKLQGKYELLPFETMDDYEFYLNKLMGKDPNGKWILETQGTDFNDIQTYSSFEAAHHAMEEEYKETDEEHDCCMDSELEDEYAVIGDEEYYQSWSIYEKKSFDNPIEEKFYEIQMELDRADTGVSQFAYELEDTDVIRDHLYKVDKLIDELKEMIK